MPQIKALVVDDSALMRKHLRDMLADAGMEVQIARDGAQALELARSFEPDVVTLDVNMPVMDGLSALERLMVERPVPVVMVSSLTAEGAAVTLTALRLGAVDFIEKPSGTVSLRLDHLHERIVQTVSAAAKVKVRRSQGLAQRLAHQRVNRPAPTPAPGRAKGPSGTPVVLIGASTGGPSVVEELLAALPAHFPGAVVVAQHMPAAFTKVFAERLDQRCAVKVREAKGRMELEPGTVTIARGDADITFSRIGQKVVIGPSPSSPSHIWHPSVERMVRSALELIPIDRLIAIQLTGMGDDGADGMAELKRRGGRTIAEAESTALVYGMPRALVERGGATKTLPSHEIAPRLLAWIDGHGA